MNSDQRITRYVSESNLNTQRTMIIDDFFHHHHFLSDGGTQLAQKLHISKRHLNRVIMQLYGKSFREKQLETRVEIAEDLLLTTDKNFKEIAEILGYNSPSHFGNMIKKRTGMTPTELRNELQKQE